MCKHLNPSRLLYVYSESNNPLRQEKIDYVPIRWLNCDYIDDPKLKESEKHSIEQLLKFKKLAKILVIQKT